MSFLELLEPYVAIDSYPARSYILQIQSVAEETAVSFPPCGHSLEDWEIQEKNVWGKKRRPNYIYKRSSNFPKNEISNINTDSLYGKLGTITHAHEIQQN